MEGRFAESLREAATARELDPLAVLSGLCLGFCTYQSRRYAEALVFCDQTLKGEPQNAMVLYCSSYALSQVGRHQEAIARASRAVEMIGKASHTLGRLASAYATAGDAARAELVLAEMAEVAQHRYISPYHVALVHCALGRKGSSLDLLESAFETKDAWIVWMAVEPELDSVRNDPRFVALLHKLNHRLANAPAKSGTLAHEFTQNKTGVVSSADDQSRVTSPMSPAPDTLPSENEEARQLYAAGRYYANAPHGRRSEAGDPAPRTRGGSSIKSSRLLMRSLPIVIRFSIGTSSRRRKKHGRKPAKLRRTQSPLILIWRKPTPRWDSFGSITIVTGSMPNASSKKQSN